MINIKDFEEHVEVLLRNIEFFEYRFDVFTSPRGETYIQGQYLDNDIYTGFTERQYTRRWLVNPNMTDSEIVSTAFKMCLTSMEHRTREGFKYKGARVYGPHFDVEDLVKLCKDGKEDAGGRK